MIFPMVVSVLWVGVGRGRGLDHVRACDEGEMEDWTDRPQQFPICPLGGPLDTCWVLREQDEGKGKKKKKEKEREKKTPGDAERRVWKASNTTGASVPHNRAHHLPTYLTWVLTLSLMLGLISRAVHHACAPPPQLPGPALCTALILHPRPRLGTP